MDYSLLFQLACFRIIGDHLALNDEMKSITWQIVSLSCSLVELISGNRWTDVDNFAYFLGITDVDRYHFFRHLIYIFNIIFDSFISFLSIPSKNNFIITCWRSNFVLVLLQLLEAYDRLPIFEDLHEIIKADLSQLLRLYSVECTALDLS